MELKIELKVKKNTRIASLRLVLFLFHSYFYAGHFVTIGNFFTQLTHTVIAFVITFFLSSFLWVNF